MFAKEFIRFWQAHVSRFAFETAPVLQRTTIVVWNESVTPILPYACRHDLRQEPDEAIPQVRICAGGAERSASLPRPTIRPESSPAAHSHESFVFQLALQRPDSPWPNQGFNSGGCQTRTFHSKAEPVSMQARRSGSLLLKVRSSRPPRRCC